MGRAHWGSDKWRMLLVFEMHISTICIWDYVAGWVFGASFAIISIGPMLCAQICYAFHLSCLDPSYLSVFLGKISVKFVFCYGHVFDHCVVCKDD